MSSPRLPLATRVEPEMRAEVNEYRRQQSPEIPPLGDAVRDLIKLGLKAAQAAQRREKKTTAT